MAHQETNDKIHQRNQRHGDNERVVGIVITQIIGGLFDGTLRKENRQQDGPNGELKNEKRVLAESKAEFVANQLQHRQNGGNGGERRNDGDEGNRAARPVKSERETEYSATKTNLGTDHEDDQQLRRHFGVFGGEISAAGADDVMGNAQDDGDGAGNDRQGLDGRQNPGSIVAFGARHRDLGQKLRETFEENLR